MTQVAVPAHHHARLLRFEPGGVPADLARPSLARVCALTSRFDEVREWFEKARHVLDEQGARPLRAITDLDEAWMEVRRGRAGNRERVLALLDAARGPFESIGMPGWLRRVEELRQQLGA